MIFTPTTIAGAWLVDLEPREDHRGSFARSFCKREFEAQGIAFDIVQANLARTLHAGVVRGLHYQEHPAEEQKLVRCVAGAVLDALVDMRPASPTYRAVYWVRLDTITRQSLFIPAGVAHGYQALADNTEFLYMTDQFYAPGVEKGVRYSDPALGVPWPLPPRDVAPRDQEWPLLG
ncbi:MAG TPA: dTDP-4-dehydrorhamnose 3,5-epimerase family protein [Albitalea sp.]|uniref:dTDP-4-dehydrorhamnose 3,5-epimerase family protein n=1 Tax=Piscinibacter sp. TaxID=1903157 RepID=UPI002ED46598